MRCSVDGMKAQILIVNLLAGAAVWAQVNDTQPAFPTPPVTGVDPGPLTNFGRTNIFTGTNNGANFTNNPIFGGATNGFTNLPPGITTAPGLTNVPPGVTTAPGLTNANIPSGVGTAPGLNNSTASGFTNRQVGAPPVNRTQPLQSLPPLTAPPLQTPPPLGTLPGTGATAPGVAPASPNTSVTRPGRPGVPNAPAGLPADAAPDNNGSLPVVPDTAPGVQTPTTVPNNPAAPPAAVPPPARVPQAGSAVRR
jgi:hypothetical protein